ncbi:33706_t:CDS:1, partial [Racocetra persica]
DTFHPTTSTRNFFSLLDSVGIPSVQLKIYEDLKHISPCIDLIVPTRRLCAHLLDDIRECCENGRPVMMNEGEEELIHDGYNR